MSRKCHTHHDIDEQEEMADTPREASMSSGKEVGDRQRLCRHGLLGPHRYLLLEIPQLVAPLRHNSESVFQERYDDQESANSGQMGSQRLRKDVDLVFRP